MKVHSTWDKLVEQLIELPQRQHQSDPKDSGFDELHDFDAVASFLERHHPELLSRSRPPH